MDGPDIGPFNIGNPNEFTMLELAEIVKEVRKSIFLEKACVIVSKQAELLKRSKEPLEWDVVLAV